jgi:Peptidase M66
VGSNGYDQSAPDAYSIPRVGDGSGDDSTAHWVFADASSTGDGIPDDWKLNGVTLDPGDGSGPQFIDLPAMGATVGKPDLFVHLDWMADKKHSHAPSSAAIKTVVDAFAAAPYISRNGSIGINLHVDAGPNSVMNFSTGAKWGGFSRAASVGHVVQLGTTNLDSSGNINYDWTEFDKLKNRVGGFFKSGRTRVFRYAVSCHQIGSVGNSGVARSIPGADFIVSLGTFTGITDTNYSGTFMHELGHTLGLGHGGGDGVNNKPNYVSVMNYLWQFTGVTRSGATLIDFSDAALAILTESALNETTGLGPGSSGVTISHWVPGVAPNPGAFVQLADASQPIDWDGDGLTTKTNVGGDVNNDGAQGALAPYNDWQKLRLKGGGVGGSGYEPATESTILSELTPQMLPLMLPADTTPPTTTASVTPVPNANGWNRTDVDVVLTATDDISGVARTEFAIDGLGTSGYSSPVPIAAEGVHDVTFSSIDRSQNVEGDHHLSVRIDKTAPEVVISYDPEADDIVVEGLDSLSGTVAGAVAPTGRVDAPWTDFGSDIAEIRTYRIADLADNVTTVYLKVRCSPVAIEASVLGLAYDDQRHRGNDQQRADRLSYVDQEGASAYLHGQGRGQFYQQQNTLVFERLVGRTPAAPLLGVRQVVAIGDGESRAVVRARYDVLDDYTILAREQGTVSCVPCTSTEPSRPNRRPGRQGARAEVTVPEPSQPSVTVTESDLRGLVILHVVSSDGRLTVKE